MAKYTTQLRSIVESGVDVFGRVDYPLFDVHYRPVLNQHIIDYYYFREIGFETVGQFKHFLKVKMNLIMPYYNNLYKSEHILTAPTFNPLHNLDTTETHSKTVETDSSGSSEIDSSQEGTNKTTSIFSDTPQAKLQNLNYATNLNDEDVDSSGSSHEKAVTSGLSNARETYETKVIGSGGMRYPADIIKEWRTAFLRIDQMIIDELNDLFMNIY